MNGIFLWENPGPDGGWSWVIMVAALMVSIMTYGFTNTGGAGLLFTELVDIFHVTREEAMWPFSILNLAQCISGLSSGILNHIISTRLLFLFCSICCSLGFILCFWMSSTLYITCAFGIMFGMGSGMVHSLSSGIICEYFVKYRSTVTGLFSAGIPFGGLVYPHLVHYILSEYDLRSTMLLLSTVMLHMFIVTLLMRARSAQNFPVLKKSLPDPDAKQESKQDELDSKQNEPEKNTSGFRAALRIYLETLREPMFYVVTYQATLSIHTLVGVSLTLRDYVRDHGIDLETAVNILTVMSASDLVGRLSCGLFVDKCSKYVKPQYVAAVAMFILGVCTFVLSGTTHVTALYIIIAFLGFSEGTATTLVNILYCDCLGLEKIFAALSFKSFVFGIVGAFRPLVLGLCRDKLGSYIYFYIILGCSSMLSTALWLLSFCIKRKRIKVVTINN